MSRPVQFNTVEMLKAVVWFSLACLVLRVLVRFPVGPDQVLGIGAVLLFVVTPFAAVGAICDRMGMGILCGLAFSMAIALLNMGSL
jgi:hypothetical protein